MTLFWFWVLALAALCLSVLVAWRDRYFRLKRRPLLLRVQRPARRAVHRPGRILTLRMAPPGRSVRRAPQRFRPRLTSRAVSVTRIDRLRLLIEDILAYLGLR